MNLRLLKLQVGNGDSKIKPLPSTDPLTPLSLGSQKTGGPVDQFMTEFCFLKKATSDINAKCQIITAVHDEILGPPSEASSAACLNNQVARTDALLDVYDDTVAQIIGDLSAVQMLLKQLPDMVALHEEQELRVQRWTSRLTKYMALKQAHIDEVRGLDLRLAGLKSEADQLKGQSDQELAASTAASCDLKTLQTERAKKTQVCESECVKVCVCFSNLMFSKLLFCGRLQLCCTLSLLHPAFCRRYSTNALHSVLAMRRLTLLSLWAKPSLVKNKLPLQLFVTVRRHPTSV